MAIYDIDGNKVLSSADSLRITAHRGCYATTFQNTIESIQEAYDDGFRYCEIDLHKCTDGVYILGHNSSVTLYNNGASTSVTFTSVAYSTIKDYTWDSTGHYRISTLQASLGLMKKLGMKMICDRKSGTNADIISIASHIGALDCIILSYTSPANALSDISLLNKYPYIPLRIWPSNYGDLETLKTSVTNPIISDMTPADSDATALGYALASGIPLLFADCTVANANRWAPIANGCMAQGSNNISYDTFKSLLDIDFNKSISLSSETTSVSVAVDGTSDVSASSNLNDYAGYVFGYSINPNIAKTKQTAWGQTATITVTGVTSGSTTLRFFTGSGSILDIPITVS